jgi:hypothetical protein
VQNEPNSGRAESRAGSRPDERCETKPIRRWPAGIRGRIVPNKAKLGQDGGSGRLRFWGAYCAKQSQFLDCGLRIEDRSATACPPYGLPTRTRAGRSCKTNPIPSAGTGPQRRGAACEMRKTNPNLGSLGDLGGGASESVSCETKPICADPNWRLNAFQITD